jgi:hypothetical protein
LKRMFSLQQQKLQAQGGLREAQADSFSVVADTCNPKTACLPKLFQRMTSEAGEKFAFKDFLSDLSPDRLLATTIAR